MYVRVGFAPSGRACSAYRRQLRAREESYQGFRKRRLAYPRYTGQCQNHISTFLRMVIFGPALLGRAVIGRMLYGRVRYPLCNGCL